MDAETTKTLRERFDFLINALMKVEKEKKLLEEEATEASETAEKALERIDELHNLLKTKEATIQLQKKERKKLLDTLTNQDVKSDVLSNSRRSNLNPINNSNLTPHFRPKFESNNIQSNNNNNTEWIKKEMLRVYHCNVRSVGNKKASIDNILRTNELDICVLTELNNRVMPNFKGFHQFNRFSNKKFHGISCIVSNRMKGNVIRIPDEDESLEIVHLLINNTNPSLNVIAVYLDVESRSDKDTIESNWAKLVGKVNSIVERGEAVCLIGDFNRPIAAKPTLGRKLLTDWIEDKESPVTLINNPNINTRIDPSTNKGSVLDLCILSKNISKCVKDFKVDTNREMTPFAMVKIKDAIVKRNTDHLAIMLDLKIPTLVKKKEKKKPVINYNNPSGWLKYRSISDNHAEEISKAVSDIENVNELETKIKIIDMMIQVESFGITWQTQSKGKKRKKQENKDLQKLYNEQAEELQEAIDKGLIGDNANQRII